jgi:hypothetical protein
MLAGVGVVFAVYLVLKFFTDGTIEFISFEAAPASVAGCHREGG